MTITARAQVAVTAPKKKLSALRVVGYGAGDISPVGMAAAMHLGLSIDNFGIQEYMRHSASTDAVFQQSFTWSGGFLHRGDEPGLGVTLEVDEAGKYPYEQAYLPFNRLADGTVHDW